jgi:anti-sigma factor RsiW
VANDGNLRHLTSERIQEFLDQALPPGEEAAVRDHLLVCSRCRSEVEEWSAVFAGLESLPELEPSPAFSREVLGALPVRRPLAARVRAWVTGGADAGAHLPPERIQDLLDGLFPSRVAARVQAHLAACERCAGEVRRWEGLYEGLEGLARVAPSPGFADGVMARVRVPVPAPAPRLAHLPARIRTWLTGLLPRTRRGWAVAGGVASAPTITLAALFYQVFSHPLLSLGTFATYAYWKASALVGALVTLLAEGLVESVALFRVYTMVETLAASPVLAGLGGLVFTLLSAGALWVLHRNLVTPSPPEGHHARARV